MLKVYIPQYLFHLYRICNEVTAYNPLVKDWVWTLAGLLCFIYSVLKVNARWESYVCLYANNFLFRFYGLIGLKYVYVLYPSEVNDLKLSNETEK
jgi:hypothetical protein